MNTARVLLLCVLVGLTAGAQEAPPAAAWRPDAPAVVSAAQHESTVKLVGLLGTRQTLEANMDKMLQLGKEKIQQQSPSANPAFVEEWGKRMKDRLKVDDLVNIVVSVYERNYTNDELVELIQVQREVNDAKTPNISPRLKEKMSAAQISVTSEIMGEFTQLGAKVGGEVGTEIGAEHPDWVKENGPARPSLPKTVKPRSRSASSAASI
jgi:hypothetical protein